MIASFFGGGSRSAEDPSDASSAKLGLEKDVVERIRQMLLDNAASDLVVVKKAQKDGTYIEPLSCLPSKRLFSMQHFALFRPLFHDFLELRLSLLQFQAQQRNIAREMGAIERLKKRRAAKLQKRLLTG